MKKSSEKNFVVLTENFRERTSPVWDMSQERALNENLLSQRFNFFIVMFSLVIAGFVNAKTQNQLQIILALGSVICMLLRSMVARTHKKLNIILSILSNDSTHPFTIIDALAAKTNPCKVKEKSWINDVGIWIPALCCTFLFVCLFLSFNGTLQVPKTLP